MCEVDHAAQACSVEVADQGWTQIWAWRADHPNHKLMDCCHSHHRLGSTPSVVSICQQHWLREHFRTQYLATPHRSQGFAVWQPREAGSALLETGQEATDGTCTMALRCALHSVNKSPPPDVPPGGGCRPSVGVNEQFGEALPGASELASRGGR